MHLARELFAKKRKKTKIKVDRTKISVSLVEWKTKTQTRAKPQRFAKLSNGTSSATVGNALTLFAKKTTFAQLAQMVANSLVATTPMETITT